LGIGNLAWSEDGRWLVHAAEEETFLWDLQILQKSLRDLGLDWED
jgi:hypothetical protein